MVNLVAYGHRPDLLPLRMNNGLAAVFISVLSIAASSRASTDHEKLIAIWIAMRDQAVLGNGLVDFKLEDIPWSPQEFAGDKYFLLKAIDAALNKEGWHNLDYTPREEWVFDCLKQFRRLIEAFLPEHLVGDGTSPDIPLDFQLCQQHHVYLHLHGCVVCNDK